jgi:hypothetical protein
MIRKLVCINSVAVIVLSLFFFVYPPVRAILDIRDPALHEPGTPNVAWRLFKNLTPRYSKWAKERVNQGRAEGLSTTDISGTEWPLFGSVFYLWGIENLQSTWDSGDHSAREEPKMFAKDAIIAASELVIDPKHASWVKKHWGNDYLRRENVFYRMLVIAALTSREKLLHDAAHLDVLTNQVETLAIELDATRSGLMDDYPGECYPGDVMAALMCIKRTDSVLGTDHSKFIRRALRGFTGTRATRHRLPPYSANSGNGIPTSEARGCGNSYMCLTSPELWPEQAMQWYALYDKFFWQERITAVGYREYSKDIPHSDWMMDVDAGPVVAGHGVAASAFGIGAARKNGRFDRAYPLTAEMLVTVGELPNGILAMPRLLSNLSDAPMLGEAAILWQLSIQPEKGFPTKTGASIPAYVYLVLISSLVFGTWRILAAIYSFRQAQRGPEPHVWTPRLQLVAWVTLVLGSTVSFCLGQSLMGMAMLVIAVMLPVTRRKRAPKGVEDWPDTSPTTAVVQPTRSGTPENV